MNARGSILLLAVALAVSASCNLQEPAAIDGLGPDPATDTLVIAPQNVAVPLGDSISFAAPDATVEGTVVSGPVEWTVSGGAGASISTTGMFRATSIGDYIVQARRSGHTGRSKARVTTAAATLTAVKVAPDAVTLQPGAAFTFAVSGVMSDGTTVPVTGTWTATGGTVTSAGVYTAGATTGQFRVIVTQQGGTFADTAAITISAAAPTLQAVEVTPTAVSLISGGVQQFSAVGRMTDNSTAAVTVTWTATGGSVNSSGRYTAGAAAGTFRVIATQQGGTKADTSTVTITPAAPTLTRVELSPTSVSLAPGGAQQFSAIGRMSDNSTSSVTVTWSATGGTVSGSGLYTAGGTAGTFRVIATQQGGTLADTASVTIAVPPPTITLTAIELTPPSASLLTGAAQQFSAVGRMSDNSTSGVAVTWSATGGTVSGSGLYTAGGTPGTYRIIAVEQGGTKADTSAITVSAPAPTLSAVEITPTTVSLQTSASQQFSAVGRMSDGSTSGVSVNWSATGGTISTSGLYTAGTSAGTFRVIAVQQGGTRADTSSVTITVPAPTLTAVELTPATVTLNTGVTQQFTTVGRMSDGSTSAVSVTYTATGGSITAGGLYTAGSTAGTFRVIAVRQGDTKADTSSITITVPAPTLTAVEVSPTTATVAAGTTQQFTALGRMSDNSTSSIAVNWSATGGTVSGTGLYTAGATAGAFRVIAVQQGGTKADTANVTVTVTAPTLSAVEVTPASASLVTGGAQQFSALGRMSDNSTTSVTVTWSATGGTITTGGLYTAGATAGAYRVIAVQQGGTRADTSAVTVSAPPANGTADPAALPAAVVGSPVAPQVSAYTALNVPGMSAGQSYVDPATGTRVVKLTDATWGTGQLGPDYAHHGRVGRNSGTRYPFLVYNPGGSRSWTVGEFDLATLRSTKKFTWTGGTQIRNELCAAFSSTQPMILYGYGSGNVLHKYDVSGSTPVELTGGGFPKSFAGHAHGESNNAWFAVSADDRWFLIMMGQGGPWVVVWDSQTDTFYETSESGLDQPGLDPNGRYVFFKGTERVWDPVTGTKTAMSVDLLSPTHMSVTRGYAFGGESNAPDNSRWYRVNLATGAVQFAPTRFLHASQNNAGGWMDQPSDGTEWVLQNNTAGGGAGASLNRAIGVFRLDGSSFRTLVNTYNAGDGSYYGDYSWPSFSPDGRVVYYKSDMNGSGHQDAFMALLPTR